jgi:hypothetical protein
MNRLSPLIVRQVRHSGRPFAEWHQPAAAPEAQLTDLRLFLTGWLGGLVFFGTFLA